MKKGLIILLLLGFFVGTAWAIKITNENMQLGSKFITGITVNQSDVGSEPGIFMVTDNGGEAFRVTDNGGEDYNVQ